MTVKTVERRSLRISYRPGRTARRFARDKVGVTCLVLLAVVLLLGLTSLFWTPYDITAQTLVDRLQPPSADHWLGTDSLGRDILSRLMAATWTAMLSCFIGMGIAVLGGVALGILAGFLEGLLDWSLSRVNDVLLALPPLLFAVAIVGALGPSLTNAMIAVGVLLLPRFFRLARITTVQCKREDYVEAARAAGVGNLRIVVRHILPNIASPLMVQISFAAAVVIVSEAGLSFLGLGAQSPTASWGSMTREGFDRLAESSWSIIPPSVILVVAILLVSLLGDALRDAGGRQQAGRS
ncbi:ABC transporter permease [Nocardia abscessus]|jgi:peptide/nickel transport system permease protein|uniref:ABC transporter permease n=1 Tax=Nocardia TaxID=1817 RepID=UPI0018963414|nr:ABC transporter permease [Nocardia abscessus]MBF6207405.1 ABC transporter permease [Streptomyces gardneri]MBF6472442.1 ABC transporter permease [Nocardia abscessus]